MSGRYIDADAIIQEAHHERKTIVTVELIESMPTADVRENVRGKWELAEDGWFCTACEMYAPIDCDPEEKGIPFCPWCGASMWKGEKDG